MRSVAFGLVTRDFLILLSLPVFFLEEEKVTTILCGIIELSRHTTTVQTICFSLFVGTFGVLVNSKPFLRVKNILCYSCRSSNDFGRLYRIRMVLLVSVTFTSFFIFFFKTFRYTYL